MPSAEFKLSNYTLAAGQDHVFNTLTGIMLRPDADQRAVLAALDDGGSVRLDPDGDTIRPLIEAGMLVDAQVREGHTLKALWLQNASAQKAPLLTIAPTMNCNFGCDYCFESHEAGHMPEDVRGALIDFIREELVAHGPQTLTVTWFGGEPLMGLPVILDLARRFGALVDEGVLSGWNSTMITNGHLATPKVMQTLIETGLSTIQVTIDGPREIHDERRVLKNGRKPTFERICANLAALPEPLNLSIRINVDRRNCEAVERLAGQLAEAGVFARGNVSMYLALVEDYSGSKALLDAGIFLKPAEFAAIQARFQRFCEDHGYPVIGETVAPSHGGVCQVDNINAFVVDPDGSLLKCWAELRNRPVTVARLTDRSSWPRPAVTALQQRDPFDDPECMGCTLLPSCMGGCPKTREMNRRLGVKACPPVKHVLADVLARMARDSQLDVGGQATASLPMEMEIQR